MVFNMTYSDTKKTKDYLFNLNEQLKYLFSHLDEEENFAQSIASFLIRQDENYALVEANAKKASWIVGNGTDETNFTLTPEFVSIVSKSIDITGYVTFTDLATEGKTEINGANITTGNFSANYINGGTITGTTIKGTTITGAEITSGTIKSGSITAETITGTTFKGGVIDIGEMLYADEDQIGLGDFTFTEHGEYEFYNTDDTFHVTEGAVECYRVLSTYNMQTYSDARLKENIREVEGALDFLDKLTPVTFRMKASGEPGIGFVAQEVKEAMGEYPLVGESRKGYLSIRYASFVPVLVAALQELKGGTG